MKLDEIKEFLKLNGLPEQIKLNDCSTITDPEKFFNSHIVILESKNPQYIKTLHYARIVRAISIIQGLEYFIYPKEDVKKWEVRNQEDAISFTGTYSQCDQQVKFLNSI